MTHAYVSVCAVLAAALLAGTPDPASASSGKRPKASIQCLPPGSSSPVSCNSVAAGSNVLVAARSQRSSAPLTFYFRELSQVRKPLRMRVDVSPQARFADGSYVVPVPRQLCAGRRSGSRYELRQLWREFNVLEPVGVINVGC